jgi:hypothetical protein
MFRIGGLAERDVTTFAIMTIPQDPETYYRVGLSDYGSALWEFVITSSLPEVQVDLTDNNDQMISRLGNLYYVVAVSGGKSVRILSGHIITDDDNGEWGEQWGDDDVWGTPDPGGWDEGGDYGGWDDEDFADWYDDEYCDGDDCENWDDEWEEGWDDEYGDGDGYDDEYEDGYGDGYGDDYDDGYDDEEWDDEWDDEEWDDEYDDENWDDEEWDGEEDGGWDYF